MPVYLRNTNSLPTRQSKYIQPSKWFAVLWGKVSHTERERERRASRGRPALQISPPLSYVTTDFSDRGETGEGDCGVLISASSLRRGRGSRRFTDWSREAVRPIDRGGDERSTATCDTQQLIIPLLRFLADAHEQMNTQVWFFLITHNACWV